METAERATYSSPELSFDGIHKMPKPLQPSGIPIWVSGTVNPAVARRLSRFGKRWIPWGPAITDLNGAIPAMKRAIADAGGDPGDLQVQGSAALVKGSDRTIDVRASVAVVPRIVADGATDIRFAGSLPSDPRRAREVLAELVSAFRKVTD